MMKPQNKIAFYIFILLIGFAFVYAYFINIDLKRNGIIIQGTILSAAFPAKSSVMEFKYQFFYMGKSFENYSPAGVINSSEFIGKIFPVYFSPTTTRSQLLITPNHFKRYNLAFPDSMVWVKKYQLKTF
ncbi:MAG: hypothetical protein ACRC2O_02250 [Chitinophagaceae bacterium]